MTQRYPGRNLSRGDKHWSSSLDSSAPPRLVEEVVEASCSGSSSFVAVEGVSIEVVAELTFPIVEFVETSGFVPSAFIDVEKQGVSFEVVAELAFSI